MDSFSTDTGNRIKVAITSYFILIKFKIQQRKLYTRGKKATPGMGENKHKRSNRQMINLQNIQAAHATQYQKNKQPNQKMGRRPR